MAPKPKAGDVEIVISGMSGRFPSCANVEEFKQKLLANEELTTDTPFWNMKMKDFPARFGKLKDYEKFDASYFGMLPMTADTADPLVRWLLEAAYEAVVDAGVNPDSLMDSNNGVYVSTSPTEANQAMFEPREARSSVRNTFTLAVCMLSQRISYWLGCTGPTMVIDTGCSGSLYALDRAIADIRDGVCDSALVGGGSTICFPYLTRLMREDQYLSADGRCRSYDADCSGFVRSEAVAMVFLQRADVAKRAYCSIVHSRCGSEGYKEEGIAYTSCKAQTKLLRLCYADCKLDPALVGYVEGHGPGTKVGDPVECRALDAVFNEKRSGPLVVGSIKGTMGHSEHVAGFCSLIKILLGMETGIIAGTYNHRNINPEIPALVSGRIKVNQKAAPFNETYAAINSFGMGGAISHFVCKRNEKKKSDNIEMSNLPWIITCSGRTEESVNIMINSIKTTPIDPEFISIMHDLHSKNLRNHIHRGFVVQDSDGSQLKDVTNFTRGKQPICFIFSGMGSQWPEMGRQMMNFPVFAASIAQTQTYLEPRGVDIHSILTNNEPGLFQYILNCFVGITAVQIALVDLLRFLEIEPDFVVGHSFGELGCAYADGGMTAEQAITASYFRGLVSIESVLPPGAMAAIGLSYEDIKDILPDGVFVACHNGPDSCTISGRKQAVLSFCKKLESKNTFVKEIDVSNIPYHTSLITTAGAKYLACLKTILQNPKERSARWITSAVGPDETDISLKKYCSAEYHCHNFLNPVLFAEAIAKIPEGAMFIEVAPHSLLRSVMKRFISNTTSYASLCERNAKNNCQNFLSAIGRLYLAGAQPQISKLYPKVQYPVSRGTKMISPLVRWDHSQDWYVPEYEDYLKKGIMLENISSTDSYADEYIQDGIPSLPVSALLLKVWESLSNVLSVDFNELPVIFSNIVFKGPVNIEGRKTISTEVYRATESFIVTVNKEVVMHGNVFAAEKIEDLWMKANIDGPSVGKNALPMKSADIYKELKLRGLQLKPRYQSINQLDYSGSTGEVAWMKDWTAALDGLLQISMLQTLTRKVQRIKKIKSIMFNPKTLTDNAVLNVIIDKNLSTISCDAIQVTGVEFETVESIKTQPNLTLEEYSFVPYVSKDDADLQTLLTHCTQLALENVATRSPRILEIRKNTAPDCLFSPHVSQAATIIGGYQCKFAISGVKGVAGIPIITNLDDEPDGSYEIVITDFPSLQRPEKLLRLLQPSGLIILDLAKDAFVSIPGYVNCMDSCWEGGKILLCKKKKIYKKFDVVAVEEEKSKAWLKQLREKLMGDNLTLLVSHNATSGIIGLVNSLCTEYSVNNLRCMLILDKEAPKFSPDLQMYSEQLGKGMVFNVFLKGNWGSFRHGPLLLPSFSSSQVLYSDGKLFLSPTHRTKIAPKNIATVHFSVAPQEDDSSMLYRSKVMWFSGKNIQGKKIMGVTLSALGPFLSSFAMNNDICFEVPEELSLQDAAATVYSYSTAILALHHLENKKSVLVTSADSPVGLALVRVGLAMKLSVFASCSSSAAVNRIRGILPELPPERIFSDQDTICLKTVMSSLNGRKVECLIQQEGSLSVNLANALESSGTLLRMNQSCSLDMDYLPEDVHLRTFNIQSSLQDADKRRYLNESLNKLLSSGITPPPNISASITDINVPVERYDEDVTQVVKLVKWRDEEKENAQPSWQVEPRCWFNPDHSYVLVGGLGGFGMEMASWMIERGARKFVFCSRSPLKNGYQAYLMKSWKDLGAEIVIAHDNITTEEGVKRILQESKSLGPVGGIIHLAAIIEFVFMSNITEALFDQMVSVKISAASLLDRLSRQLCPELEHFILFSSVITTRSSTGSGAYSYGCSALDRLCEKRVKEGYPAKSLKWGIIGDVGVVAEHSEFSFATLNAQPIASCLSLLDVLLLHKSPVLGSSVIAKTQAIESKNTSIKARLLELMCLSNDDSLAADVHFSTLGMDSILAVSIKTALEEEFGVNLSIPEIRKLTISKCATL